ncbi:DMT family transporter [Pseudochelatococcus lubricantis]|uniref:DMT family transporter n=1 Tax=Pseudochelatococcus lubricantis TaxID=1538102 RepID=UPI0035E858F8
MRQPSGVRAQGVAYGCAVVALFAGFVIVSRLGLSASLAPSDVAALRFGIAGLLLSPILMKHGLSGLGATEAAVLSVSGGLGFALFVYAGFALAPAAHGTVLLHGTLPLTTAVLMRTFASAKAPEGRGTGLALIALGVLAMAWDGLSHASPMLLAGDLCLLLASFCWSGYGLYVRRLGLPATRAAAIVTGLSALTFLPVYALLPGKALFHTPWRDLLVQGIFQGAVIGVASIVIYTRAIVLLGATRLAFFTAAVPALTTLAGIPLLGETPGVAAGLGVGLVTAGMIAGLRQADPD